VNIWEITKLLRKGKMPPMGEIPAPLLNAITTMGHLRGKFSRLSCIERALTAIQHKEPDRVPVTPLLNSAARQITGVSFPEYSLDTDKTAEVFLSGFEFVGGDLVILLLDLSVEAADFGQKIIYPENSTARPDYSNPCVKDVADYHRIPRIRLSETRRMKEFVRLCRIMVERIGFRALVTGFVFGPLGVLSMMRGAEPLFKDCVNYPKDVIKACETITETLIEFVQAQCDTGVSAVAIDTLYASWNGLPRDLWEAIEGPFAREISRVIKGNGLPVGVHNCGHGLYFDSQIKFMEPDVISFAHLPDDCKSAKDLKERYGDQVTLLGYVPTPLLVHGSPKEVMDECRRQIEVLGRDGGFILSPGCEYPPNIPLTNAFAVVKAAQQYS
jgi:uroporphyrinogen decarboxylase